MSLSRREAALVVTTQLSRIDCVEVIASRFSRPADFVRGLFFDKHQDYSNCDGHLTRPK
jgi:hypothetical protein